MTAPSLTETGATTEKAALPGDLYGTRDAIFHLLRDPSDTASDRLVDGQNRDRQNAPTPPPLEEDTVPAPVLTVTKYRPKSVAERLPVQMQTSAAVANQDTNLNDLGDIEKKEPEQADPISTFASEGTQGLNKARFREKQHVAKGTSARFTPKAASAPLVLASAKRAKPVKKKAAKFGAAEKPLSPDAMAVLRGYLHLVANTDSPTTQTSGASDTAQNASLETASVTIPRRRAPLPLPRPVVSPDTLEQIFNEDHFEFQSASKAAALRDRMEERRMQAAS